MLFEKAAQSGGEDDGWGEPGPHQQEGKVMPGIPEGPELIRRLQEQERKQLRDMPQLPPVGPATIHHTQLADPIRGSPIAAEWDYYRREVGRLLAEGHEGKWVLIKGEQIVGIWSSEE